MKSKVKGKAVNAAIAWRLQRQFAVVDAQDNELNSHSDKGGFVIGCQLSHALAEIDREYSWIKKNKAPVLLIFDIFANDGLGADRKVGPTRVVKRQVVRAFKHHYRNVLVVEMLLQHLTDEERLALDPLGLLRSDKETFISWIEVALGYNMKLLVDAGGHFSEVIQELRGSSQPTLHIEHPHYCFPEELEVQAHWKRHKQKEWTSGDQADQDDLAGKLYHKKSKMDFIPINYYLLIIRRPHFRG